MQQEGKLGKGFLELYFKLNDSDILIYFIIGIMKDISSNVFITFRKNLIAMELLWQNIS